MHYRHTQQDTRDILASCRVLASAVCGLPCQQWPWMLACANVRQVNGTWREAVSRACRRPRSHGFDQSERSWARERAGRCTSQLCQRTISPVARSTSGRVSPCIFTLVYISALWTGRSSTQWVCDGEITHRFALSTVLLFCLLRRTPVYARRSVHLVS